VNMVMRDELVRKKKRRLGSFRNMTRSLEAGLRDRRRNEIDELISMAAGRAPARGGKLTRATAASRGRDGSGGVRGSAYIARRRFK
jgi:hypothetical protein